MKIYLFVLKFLFIGALFIVSNNNLHIINLEERNVFYSHFYSWLLGLFDSVGQIVGYVTKSEWLPQINPQQTIPQGNFLSP